ncbi:MAG: hypothetical protein IPL86_15460 [Flavobacteriales bacterium]|nr:hypothetical protein [Flavobacteriales bacterium]
MKRAVALRVTLFWIVPFRTVVTVTGVRLATASLSPSLVASLELQLANMTLISNAVVSTQSLLKIKLTNGLSVFIRVHPWLKIRGSAFIIASALMR